MTCLTMVACVGFAVLSYFEKKPKPEPKSKMQEVRAD